MTTVAVVDADVRLAGLCKALGSPARLAILRFLKDRPGPSACRAIVDQLPLAQSTVSEHLQVLREVGWIQSCVAQPRARYRLDPATLEEFRRLVGSL